MGLSSICITVRSSTYAVSTSNSLILLRSKLWIVLLASFRGSIALYDEVIATFIIILLLLLAAVSREGLWSSKHFSDKVAVFSLPPSTPWERMMARGCWRTCAQSCPPCCPSQLGQVKEEEEEENLPDALLSSHLRTCLNAFCSTCCCWILLLVQQQGGRRWRHFLRLVLVCWSAHSKFKQNDFLRFCFIVCWSAHSNFGQNDAANFFTEAVVVSCLPKVLETERYSKLRGGVKKLGKVASIFHAKEVTLCDNSNT